MRPPLLKLELKLNSRYVMEEKFDGSAESKYIICIVLQNFAGVELKLDLRNGCLLDATMPKLDFEWACTGSLRRFELCEAPAL